MIKLIILDIDGVITDGTIIVNTNGEEQKRINLKDIDAIFELKRRGYKLAAITGESTSIVEYFKNRFSWDYFFCGKKDKIDVIKEIEKSENIGKDNICYVGDGKYDIEPLSYVCLGVCPNDAISMVQNVADVILQNSGGQGCLWELIDIIDNYNDKDSYYHFFMGKVYEHNRIFKSILSNVELIDKITLVSNIIIDLFNNKRQLFFCGNGGSAADGQHIATEFVSRFYKERKALNAEALTVNTSSLTAIGNDYNFDRVFVRQLEAKASEGDLLIGISTSGTAKNVLEALKYAKSAGLTTVLLTGNGIDYTEHNTTYAYIDHILKVPSVDTPRIQEAHIFIGHLLAEYVEAKFSGEEE